MKELGNLDRDHAVFLHAGRNPFDLAVTDITFPDGTQAGPGRTVRITVANVGYESVPYFRVRLFRVPNEGGMGEQIGFTSMQNAIAPGPITRSDPAQSRLNGGFPVAWWDPTTRSVDIVTTLEEVGMNLRASVEVPPGATATPDTNTYNNDRSTYVPVAAAPYVAPPQPPFNDLEVCDIGFPYGAPSGMTTTARVLVQSNGPGAMGGSIVRLYAGAPGAASTLVGERTSISVAPVAGPAPIVGGNM